MPDAPPTPPPPAAPPPGPVDQPPPPRLPFDPVRAAFFLVAGVLTVQCLVVLAGAAMCLIYAAEIIQGRFQCDAHNKLGDILAEALAAALAFAGGFGRRS